MSVEETLTAKKPWRFMPWLVAGGLTLLLALAWTAFWHFAAMESERIVDAWIAREKGLGRIWSCPDRKIEGFPFTIDIACTKPRFDGAILGKHFAGDLSGFHATAVLIHPSVVTARIASPFTIFSDDRKVELKLAWADLQVVLDGLPQSVWRVAIAGESLTAHGTLEGLGSLASSAGGLMVDAAAHPDQVDQSYDFHLAVSAATLPEVDRFLGAALPADIVAQGTLTKAAIDPALTLAENLDHWRAVGGRLDLINASLTHGETTFAAHGALSLDDAHRVQGKLDTESRGFEPLLRRLGVNPALVNAGALLSNLITGTLPSDAGSASEESLHVSVGFDGGRLSIGPVRTSIHLPPLY